MKALASRYDAEAAENFLLALSAEDITGENTHDVSSDFV